MPGAGVDVSCLPLSNPILRSSHRHHHHNPADSCLLLRRGYFLTPTSDAAGLLQWGKFHRNQVTIHSGTIDEVTAADSVEKDVVDVVAADAADVGDPGAVTARSGLAS
jgi:hypothetical protein